MFYILPFWQIKNLHTHGKNKLWNHFTDNEPIQLTLWQKGRRLAYFRDRLESIINSNLYENSRCEQLRTLYSWSSNASIIMKPSTCFPGIIGPKCELTARIEIFENNDNSRLENRPTIKSYCCKTLHGSSPSKSSSYYHWLNCNRTEPVRIKRQRPVCHAKSIQRFLNCKFIYTECVYRFK